MATNDRIDYTSGDISHEQLSTTGENRTIFTPGKAGSAQDDRVFEEFRVPTGVPAFDAESAGPVQMEYSRVVKLGRGVVSDQVIPELTTSNTRVEAFTSNGVSGTHVVEEKEVANPSDIEKTSGQDRIVGA